MLRHTGLKPGAKDQTLCIAPGFNPVWRNITNQYRSAKNWLPEKKNPGYISRDSPFLVNTDIVGI